MQRFIVLDSFRGIAAIFVLCFHLHIIDAFTQEPLFRNANYFVEFFFVLSGFVIYYAYAERVSSKSISFRDYLVLRFFRIFPLHLFILLVVIFLEFVKLQASHNGFIFNASPFTGRTELSELWGNILLLQSWLPIFDELSFNSPSWSISVEFYIYIIFFVIFAIYNKVRVFLMLFLIASILYVTEVYLVKPGALKGIFCFSLGIMVGSFRRYFSGLGANKLLSTVTEIISVFILLWILMFDIDNKSVIISIYFSFLILIFSFEEGMISSLLKNKMFVSIGRLSYSIYLSHYIIIFIYLSLLIVASKLMGVELTSMISGERYIDAGSKMTNNLIAISIIFFTILISKVTYKYIELPFIGYSKKVLGRCNRKYSVC